MLYYLYMIFLHVMDRLDPKSPNLISFELLIIIFLKEISK